MNVLQHAATRTHLSQRLCARFYQQQAASRARPPPSTYASGTDQSSQYRPFNGGQQRSNKQYNQQKWDAPSRHPRAGGGGGGGGAGRNMLLQQERARQRAELDPQSSTTGKKAPPAPPEPEFEPKLLTFPTNKKIPYPVVQIQNPDGTLQDPTALASILASMDSTTHLVRLVSHTPPTVRVLTHLEDRTAKVERRAERKAQAEKSRHGRVSTKVVQVSWFVTPEDYRRSVALVREELAKPATRVEFVFNAKRGRQNPRRAEMGAMMEKLVGEVGDRGFEWKDPRMGMGKGVVYLQSRAKFDDVKKEEEDFEEVARRELAQKERSLRHARKRGSVFDEIDS